MKHKVLWIEDGALGDLPDLAGVVVVEGSYELIIALDATEGIECIMQNEFEAVIVDIRLPPGDDLQWRQIYNHPNKNKNASRLGLLVLRSLLKPEKSEVKIKDIPKWVNADRFGVLTVESQREVQKDLDELDIKIYRQKTRKPSTHTLLDLIREVMQHAAGSKVGGIRP
jgi:hypothetical protein